MSPPFPVVAATGSVELSAGQVLLVAGMLNGRREGRGWGIEGCTVTTNQTHCCRLRNREYHPPPAATGSMLSSQTWTMLDWIGGEGSGRGLGWCEGVRQQHEQPSPLVHSHTRLFPI